ncbi:MAG TPA: aminoacetone oxidase family FAD-binding enzyme, partial [Spirochaetota bacterium]|nr:aminoacetone oxidase family FAD-binding enzyme [Spirochaetota bacterium]
MNNYDIIITGTGPAGLFCAINCADNPAAKILVLEKNSSPGKKFLLSGTGQCNITHTGNVSDFTRHYGNGGDFVKPALSAFTPAAMINFLHGNDIPTVEKENGKIFPESMRAIDILSMLIELCENKGVDFRYESPVDETVYENGEFTVTIDNVEKEKFHAPVLVIATGGESYPATGSTGDGFKFAGSLGHKIVATAPSLAPVHIRNFLFAELSGISFKNRKVSLFNNGKKTYSSAGDILFTHKGLSGPAILDMSRYAGKGDIIEISLAGKTSEEMNADFIAESRAQGKKSIKNFLKSYDIPERLIIMILAQEGIDPLKNVSEINKTERVKL